MRCITEGGSPGFRLRSRLLVAGSLEMGWLMRVEDQDVQDMQAWASHQLHTGSDGTGRVRDCEIRWSQSPLVGFGLPPEMSCSGYCDNGDLENRRVCAAANNIESE